MEIFEPILAIYSTLSLGWQAGITAVLGFLVILTHVLPHLDQKFGKFGEYSKPLAAFFGRLMNILAGNYKNTRNQ